MASRFPAALTLTILTTVGLAAAPAQARERPAVVELFTSQGCSSCPPANAAVAALSERPDIIALSFGVTYWDDLGWKDTFARADFTARQRAYAKALGHKSPYTPEVVVNGRADTVGATQGAILRLADRGRPVDVTEISLQDGAVALGAGKAPRGGAEVWLVRYDPRTVQVPIKRGENTGKTLPHKNVVRDLKKLGRWTGAPVRFAVSAAAPGLKTVVLIQSPGGGPILAAKRDG